jgi:hypothetical protein
MLEGVTHEMVGSPKICLEVKKNQEEYGKWMFATDCGARGSPPRTSLYQSEEKIISSKSDWSKTKEES